MDNSKELFDIFSRTGYVSMLDAISISCCNKDLQTLTKLYINDIIKHDKNDTIIKLTILASGNKSDNAIIEEVKEFKYKLHSYNPEIIESLLNKDAFYTSAYNQDVFLNEILKGDLFSNEGSKTVENIIRRFLDWNLQPEITNEQKVHAFAFIPKLFMKLIDFSNPSKSKNIEIMTNRFFIVTVLQKIKYYLNNTSYIENELEKQAFTVLLKKGHHHISAWHYHLNTSTKICEGTLGGLYYQNRNGKKVYIRKTV